MKSLELILQQNEWLTMTGYGGSGREELSNAVSPFVSACEWIDHYMRKAPEINRQRTSYGIKHICEREVDQYISNGVMIAAFLACDYLWERDGRSFNLMFNASESAIRVAESLLTNGHFSGCVYFIESSSGVFKIGMTRGLPEDRMAQLQTASSDRLTIFRAVNVSDPKNLEKLLHEHFAEYRLKGEWFRISRDMIDEALDDL